ncbi:MAG: hypothetical protein LIP16_18410 [Clostridium sp.]|nr:hypothetical protein [Clostridium sp.]
MQIEKKKAERMEWVFIAGLIIPVIILGKMKLHQRNLAQFLVISLICVIAVLTGYFFFCKSADKKDD